MVTLPIDREIPRIIEEIRRRRAAVVVAEPGAGKTTRLPPAVLRAGLLAGENPHLLMLQPRRMAARLAARRIADEQRWTVGNEVGYQVRFERNISAHTQLRILTEGILSRQLLDDPYLPGVGGVVLDEFHERSLHGDMLIAMLRELRQTVRPDLILIVMSATLEAAPVAKYLGDAPIVEIPGRTFPVEIEYRGLEAGRVEHKVAGAVRDVLSSPGKDILVFLPGAEEIRRTQNELSNTGDAHVYALHGSLTASEQDEAVGPSEHRKIILATNIAETSLTIPGVDTVIDSGFERLPVFDQSRGLDRLDLVRISKASAKQRAGRAGRIGPGKCIRLWTSREQEALDNFQKPEIHRVDLSWALLALHAWGAGDVRKFDWYERPGDAVLEAGESLLRNLGAIEIPSVECSGRSRITEIGRQMLGLPVPVRVARLMIDAHRLGLEHEGATIAALVSEKDFLRRNHPTDSIDRGAQLIGESDLLQRMRLLEEFEKGRSQDHGHLEIDTGAARNVLKVRDHLERLIPGKATNRRAGEEEILKLVLVAFPDRVVRRRANDPRAGLMTGGAGVRLAAESVVWRGEFYVAVDLQMDQRSRKSEAMIRMASRIEREWLIEIFPQFIERTSNLNFDAQRGKVVCSVRSFYRDLLIAEHDEVPRDLNATGRILGAALESRAEEFFNADDDSRQWLARLALLRRVMPEQSWPQIDGSRMKQILGGAAAGKRGVEELASPATLLQSTLEYPLDRLFELHAPKTIRVPSGSSIAIDYLAVTGPVLAVRLQEMFGLSTTPTVCGGRVPLTLHLLAPNFRPVQVTADLASFWKTAYFQVKKDLKRRYPKHAWPDDPLSAAPQAKGRART